MYKFKEISRTGYGVTNTRTFECVTSEDVDIQKVQKWIDTHYNPAGYGQPAVAIDKTEEGNNRVTVIVQASCD